MGTKTRWLLIPMGTVLAILLTGAASLVIDRHDLPGFDLDKPAAKLTMECLPEHAQYTVGDFIIMRCTITNISEDMVPITWNPQVGNFLQHEGTKLDFGGRPWIGYPEIAEPIVIQSWIDHPTNYTLYLPAKASLAFEIQLGKAEKPEQFSGTMVYDPLPPYGGGPFGLGASPTERYIFSNLLDYTVVAGK